MFRIIPITDARDACCERPATNHVIVGLTFSHTRSSSPFVNHPVEMSTSTTTTQILFNSPALHSLKREQLLKLCKIHNIRTTGKNVDLIERLELHAAALPPDAPLSVAVRSEADSDSMSVDESPRRPSRRHSPLPRPSEGWEVVMDNIQEVPETSSSLNTLNSLPTANGNNAGEFGTANSKCKSIVFIV